MNIRNIINHDLHPDADFLRCPHAFPGILERQISSVLKSGKRDVLNRKSPKKFRVTPMEQDEWADLCIAIEHYTGVAWAIPRWADGAGVEAAISFLRWGIDLESPLGVVAYHILREARIMEGSARVNLLEAWHVWLLIRSVRRILSYLASLPHNEGKANEINAHGSLSSGTIYGGPRVKTVLRIRLGATKPAPSTLLPAGQVPVMHPVTYRVARFVRGPLRGHAAARRSFVLDGRSAVSFARVNMRSGRIEGAAWDPA